MRRFVPWILALTAAAAAPRVPYILAHPDFSGTWALDVSKSEGPMLPTSSTLKVTQTEKSMTVERTTTMMGGTRTTTATYNLDGSPSKNTVNANGASVEFNSTAEWNDNVLVIKTTADFGAGPFNGTDRYSLSEDKKSLAIASEASAGGQSVSGKLTFVKQ